MIFAKKSLGQHFLNSRHVLDQIISASNITNGENILEIGPGTGILTTELLKAGANVIAIEKDHRAYEILNEKFKDEIKNHQLTLIMGDVLDPKMKEIVFDKNNFFSSYSIVANIPYYITGAILEKFLEYDPRPQKMILLVQKEVADRIVARPDKPDEKGKESILSISVKVFGTPKIIAKVPPGAFTPPPTVDSAILSIENVSSERFGHYLLENPDYISNFFKIVRSGFAHKRKFAKRNIENIMDKNIVNKTWSELGLDDKIRAEDLTPQNWLDICKSINAK